MPRLKKSQGTQYFTTPFVAELQRYVWYELVNMMHWNPETVECKSFGPGRWKFVCSSSEKKLLWEIQFDGANIAITSNLPIVHIRKGLSFNMGNGQIVIQGRESL